MPLKERFERYFGKKRTWKMQYRKHLPKYTSMQSVSKK